MNNLKITEEEKSNYLKFGVPIVRELAALCVKDPFEETGSVLLEPGLGDVENIRWVMGADIEVWYQNGRVRYYPEKRVLYYEM